MLLLAVIAGLYVLAALVFAAFAELYARGFLARGEYGTQGAGERENASRAVP